RTELKPTMRWLTSIPDDVRSLGVCEEVRMEMIEWDSVFTLILAGVATVSGAWMLVLLLYALWRHSWPQGRWAKVHGESEPHRHGPVKEPLAGEHPKYPASSTGDGQPKHI